MSKTITTCQMTLKRTTKGAILYEATNKNGGALTSLYLRKEGLTEPFPALIEVVIRVDEGE